MVKSYQRYEQERCFGVIASNSNAIWLPPSETQSRTSSGRAITAALEEILIWDIKTGELIKRLRDGVNPGASDATTSSAPSAVSCLQYSEPTNIIAAGYQDGSIKIWDLTSGSVMVNFQGHKTSVNLLKFDRSGTRLVSGSHDANIILWDLVGETGLFKLRGHKDQITGLWFLSESDEDSDEMEDWLVSTSKDGLIKLWDLKSQQCIETHVAHTGECWSLGVDSTKSMAITTGGKDQVKVWAIDLTQETTKLIEKGDFEKTSKSRCTEVSFKVIGSTSMFYLQNSDRTVELFRIRSQEEISKAITKRTKRLNEKGYDEDEIAQAIREGEIGMLITPLTTLRAQSKIRSCVWANCTSNKIELLCTLNNNSIETYSIQLPESIKRATPNEIVPTKQFAIELLGHRADVRSVDISSDNKLLATASNGLLKIWNIKTTNCLRTFECGYALCTKFLPGGSLIVVGTKSGEVELYDLASSSLLDTIQAHSDAIWSLDITPDGKSLVTGSTDKTVKFWDFKVEQELVPGTEKYVSKMKLFHNRTLELDEDVLSVRISPDAKYLAVSLLNNNVQVVFFDSLKLFLTLYGHKLPVLSIDISFDSKLIITSSADKNIKIWGMDFGDCHKSIFGHQDSIMNVKFVPQSHNFFSSGKDGLIKYWDGDKFDCIQKLPAHQSEVWSIAVSYNGEFMISTSHDHSIRVWYETEDQVFLEEEKEKEMDELYENTLLESLEGDEMHSKKEGEEDDDEAERVGKQTMETLKAGEKIMEALEIGMKDLEENEDYLAHLAKAKARKTQLPVPPTKNAILMALNLSGSEYVLQTVLKIRPAQLEDALLVLPFSYSMRLFKFIEIWTNKENVSKNVVNLSLICRILFFIIRSNSRELVNKKDSELKKQLLIVKEQIRNELKSNINELGVNIQGLRYIKQSWNMNHSTEFIDEYEQQKHEEKTSKKRVYTTVA